MVTNWMAYFFKKYIYIKIAAYWINLDQPWLTWETRHIRYEIIIKP
jgi:hypothetical protein